MESSKSDQTSLQWNMCVQQDLHLLLRWPKAKSFGILGNFNTSLGYYNKYTLYKKKTTKSKYVTNYLHYKVQVNSKQMSLSMLRLISPSQPTIFFPVEIKLIQNITKLKYLLAVFYM